MASPNTAPARRQHPADERGFTVIELIISLFVVALVLVGMLGIFDATSRVARAQTHVSEAQQSVRVAQNEVVKMTRMVARGWSRTTFSPWKVTQQVKVDDNVGTAVFINGGSDPQLKVRAGTDVLRLQGVINGSIFHVTHPSDVKLSNELAIKERSPAGIRQDLDQLQKAKDDGNQFWLLVANRLGATGLVKAQLVADVDVDATDGLETARISITMPDCAAPAAPDYVTQQEWLCATPVPPIDMVGIIEEYAFYVRENGGQPRLSMARFQPRFGQAVLPSVDPYGGKVEFLRQDISDNILDLQIALGVDNYIGVTGRGDKVVAADEWILDSTSVPDVVPAFDVAADLFYIRVTTLARTAGQDPQYVSPAIAAIENHNYSEPAKPTNATEINDRLYRRRLITTQIDVRNM